MAATLLGRGCPAPRAPAAQPFRAGQAAGGSTHIARPACWRARGRYAPRGMQVVCMANQRRVARVAKQIERELGVLLQGDQVLQNAICPEHRIGYDSSLSALASVTEVQLSGDLQVAKVYLSIYSDQAGRSAALKGLSRLQGYVRTRLANQMQLRMVPEIRFIHDEAAERGEEVLELLERIKRQDAGEEERPPVALRPLPEEQPRASGSGAAAGKAAARGAAAEEPEEDGFLNLEEEEDGFLVDDFQADAAGFLPKGGEAELLYARASAGYSAEYDLKFDGDAEAARRGGGGGRRSGGQRPKRKQRSKRR